MRAPSGPDVVVHALLATPSPLTQAEHLLLRVKTSVRHKCFVINAVRGDTAPPETSSSYLAIRSTRIYIYISACQRRNEKPRNIILYALSNLSSTDGRKST